MGKDEREEEEHTGIKGFRIRVQTNFARHLPFSLRGICSVNDFWNWDSRGLLT